jgi:hypothetical protein
MGARDAEQAFELIRALREQVHEMTTQLNSLERRGPMNSISRAATVRSEIAALRRDINQAQMFISRLKRRYLPDNRDGHTSRPAQPPQAR